MEKQKTITHKDIMKGFFIDCVLFQSKDDFHRILGAIVWLDIAICIASIIGNHL